MSPEMNLTMSPVVNELMAALSKAQSKIQPASKGKDNPFFKTKYADLSSVWEACRQAITDQGLSVIQFPQTKPEGLYLVSILGHASGQWIRAEVEVPLAKKDPQSIGSAITYFRRYMLAALVGVAPDDDDDGEKAQQTFRTAHVTKTVEAAKTPNMITPEQIKDLQMTLEDCPKEYQETAREYKIGRAHV